jgi:hypothetical protein
MNRQPVATASSYYTHAYTPSSSSQQQVPAHGHYHDPSAAAYVSVGYRPLQLPTQRQLQHYQHNQVAAEQQLSLAGNSSTNSFHHPDFRTQHNHQPSLPPLQQTLPVRTRAQLRLQQQQQQHQQQVMASYQEQSAEEMAELQKLSNEYQPEVTVRELYLFDLLWAKVER